MADNFNPDAYPMEDIRKEVFAILGPRNDIISYNAIKDAVAAGIAPHLGEVFMMKMQPRKYTLTRILKELGAEPWTQKYGHSVASWRFSREV